MGKKVKRKEPRKRGRPEEFTRLPGKPEDVARALFSAVKPPDPSRRIKRKG